jgi:1,4-dihydroxy-2-naphthoyl-CoA hydrolase
VGSVVRGECLPLHRGRRTMVWETRISNAEGRLLVKVTQTQMVFEAAAG